MLKRRLKSNWKKIFVIILCIALIAVHSIWSQIKFDSINIWLGVIAIILFLFPKPDFLFPYMKRIKRFKAWELELELSDLEDKVEKAGAESYGTDLPGKVAPEVEEVIKEASKDPRAALLLLSSKIETIVRERLQDAKINLEEYATGATRMRLPSTQQAIQIGIDQGIFPPTVLPAYKDFMVIRNRIAHDYKFQVENATILSLISLGSELLKLLSAKKPDSK